MNKIHIISDTHFGHAKILDFEAGARSFASIKDHDDALVDNWNSVVNKNDTVWHLGDVLFGGNSFDILGRLNGIKKLVMGNHDRYPMNKYLEHFSQVFGAAKIDNCILTHVPIHPSQFYRFRGNIHGHLHSNIIDDARYVNVSAEQVNLTPVLLSEVLARLPEIAISKINLT